ncbi:MAG TPA: hypothetical protein VEJ41_02940 [Candidatus Acidoferrales bacterium]|nr:hypothetical protein [Candidatus Acidoferrales bacterium]
MNIQLGRYVFGAAAVLFGIVTLVFRELNDWQQFQFFDGLATNATFATVIGAAQLVGGIAILLPKTARTGAVVLGVLELIFALTWLPLFAEKPAVYDRLANFFEQFSQFAGALIVYATFQASDSRRALNLANVGRILFGFCVVSFAVEQIVYIHGTAEFVPKWIPPDQMFWAVTTTVAFVLAAIAILTGRAALLAARLLTAMIIIFGLTIWLPAIFPHPHDITSWAGNAENLAIAGAAWILADFLSQRDVA